MLPTIIVGNVENVYLYSPSIHAVFRTSPFRPKTRHSPILPMSQKIQKGTFGREGAAAKEGECPVLGGLVGM